MAAASTRRLASSASPENRGLRADWKALLLTPVSGNTAGDLFPQDGYDDLTLSWPNIAFKMEYLLPGAQYELPLTQGDTQGRAQERGL